MIRWVFYFEEGSVKTETISDEDDVKIRGYVRDNPKGTLLLPNAEMEIWVNLEHVKCITRQIVDEEAERKAAEEKAVA